MNEKKENPDPPRKKNKTKNKRTNKKENKAKNEIKIPLPRNQTKLMPIAIFNH